MQFDRFRKHARPSMNLFSESLPMEVWPPERIWFNWCCMLNILGRRKNRKHDTTNKSLSTRSPGSMQYSMSYLKQTIEKLRTQKICDATRAAYHSVWVRFNDFLWIWIGDPSLGRTDWLSLLLSSWIQKQPQPTIQSYTSTIKCVLCEDGIVINDNSYLLASLLKACKFTERDEIHMCLPI